MFIRETVESDLEKMLVEKQKLLRATLRTMSPFFTDAALDKMLGDAMDVIRESIRQQAPVITASKARFNFFSLPAELRNRIYEDVLGEPQNLCVQSITLCYDEEFGDWATYGDDRKKQPAICQVCSQMRQETLPMYYNRHHFEAYIELETDYVHVSTRTSKLHAWLQKIGPDQARFIKHLTIKFPLPECSCSWSDGYCTDELCSVRAPKSSEDVWSHLKLQSHGTKSSVVRALFGAHIHRDEDCSDGPFRGDHWKEVDYGEFELKKLWWTPVPGEKCRKYDNFDLDSGDDSEVEVDEKSFED